MSSSLGSDATRVGARKLPARNPPTALPSHTSTSRRVTPSAGCSAAGLALPVSFLSFQRGFESEADYLGLQYMYKTGYDPQAFVSFFEKLQAKEKRKPGTLAKAFSTHPQTPDRIEKSQEEISKILPARAQYVVTTSEFDDVKSRLAVSFVDAQVGRLVGALDRLGLAKNTLVILFADNGAFKAQIGYASNDPFRTEKEMIYEGSIRVMSMVRWPGRIRPGVLLALVSSETLGLLTTLNASRRKRTKKRNTASPSRRWTRPWPRSSCRRCRIRSRWPKPSARM